VLSWNHDTTFFVALTLTAALWIVLHLALTLVAARARKLPLWLRASAWLPPLTLLAGFWSGARLLTACWMIVMGAYLVLSMLV
jgi:hypothetical protein